MRIALVHDYIKEYGGAERVLETLHEMFPDAPVFTLVYCPEFLGPHQARFKNWDIKTSPFNDIPFKEKFISIYRLFAPFIFPLFNFSEYDVVIVSATGAYSPNTIHVQRDPSTSPSTSTGLPSSKGRLRMTKVICYCHTPPRYLYGYATAREWKKNPLIRLLAETLNVWLRNVDKESSKNVDQYIANSEEVKSRIKKFYGKDAIVVYPPVDVVGKSGKKEDYFVTGGRLARPKHFELIIRAANGLQLPLKIFGKGFAGYGEELRSIAGPTIEFVGEVSDKEKLELMGKAKAFFMASEDEDFGIVPVEAMGVGTPVIAYKSGGLKETVVDGKTGVFFDELTVASIIEAVKKFQKAKISSLDCIRQAEKFDRKHFEKGIRDILQKYA